MRSVWWLAIALSTACGDVVKVPDAAIPDAYQADAPDDLMCSPGEMVCNNTCANTMTSELYCGNCNTQCSPTQGCVNGSCVPANTTCARVREIDADAPDGLYTNPNNGISMYCSFSTGVGYEDLVVNPFNATPTGMIVARAADFADPVFVKAFIALYNKNNGVRSFSNWTSSNCCFTAVAGSRIHFGGQVPFPGFGTASACNSATSTGQIVTFGRNAANFMTTLPDDFFTQFPVTEAAACGDGANPAWWFKRTVLN